MGGGGGGAALIQNHHCLFPIEQIECKNFDLSQGSHRLEKYLNIQDCLEKSLNLKFALKNTWKTLKGLEKSLNFTIYRRIQQCFWRTKSV